MVELEYEEKPQYRMVWPGTRLEHPPEVVLPEGYAMRSYARGDEERIVELMRSVGWNDWDGRKLDFALSRAIPRGWFVAVEEISGEIVASATALHNYKETTPFWGNVGWVACDPKHTGKGLGSAVTAAVTARMLEAGYTRIDLYTEYYRPAAIRIYLKLGYVPVLASEEVAGMWRESCAEVDLPFTPGEWEQVLPDLEVS